MAKRTKIVKSTKSISNNINTKTESLNNLEKVSKRKTFFNRKIIMLFLVMVFLLTALYFSKSMFVVAFVDGKPIYRWSLNKILEEQGGSQTLDFLVVEKLVSAEAQKRNIDVSQAVADQIKTETETVTAQGATLDQWLAYQGYTRTIYEKELKIRKEAEEIVKDKLTVNDDEVKEYLEENKSLYEGREETEDLKSEVRETLRQQKFNSEFSKWIEEAKTESNILYFLTFPNNKV